MPNQIGDRIKRLRRELNLSQEDVARRAGYNDRSVIAKFESGRSVPDSKLADLAAALETTPAYLLGTVRNRLPTLGITVSELTSGGAELTDTQTGAAMFYSSFVWNELQANEDYRTIFRDLQARRPGGPLSEAAFELPADQPPGDLNILSSGNVAISGNAGTGKSSLLSTRYDELTKHFTEPHLSSAAFFQEARQLNDAVIKGKVDPADGLKENVVIGKLIPAGTGLTAYRNVPPAEPAEADIDPQLLEHLRQLTPDELTKVDAFVQGLLAAREA